MSAVAWLTATLFFCLVAGAAEPTRNAPTYSASSVVNAATNETGPLAPLALVSLYGVNLAVATRALSADDVRNGQLPTTLIGTGVTIAIDNIAVAIIFVSPGQVNFLVPGNMRPGKRRLRLAVNGLTGPEVAVEIADSAPGFFQWEPGAVIATRPDGTLITAKVPAVPGEILVIYAAGLGATQPAITGLHIPIAAASIQARSEFALLLNDVPVPDDHILYAGVTPGFAGLYQINCRLPLSTPSNPEIRIRFPGRISPASLFLAVGPARPREI